LREWTEELESLIGENHNFVLDILSFLNEIEFIKEPQKYNLEDLVKEIREMKDTATIERKKLLDLITGTDLKNHIYHLKTIKSDYLKEYSKMTSDYNLLYSSEYKEQSNTSHVTETFNYFYGQLIHGKKYNESYGPPSSKVKDMITIDEFRRVCSLKSTCPYCDINKLEYDLASIDHYLPKKKFPFLSIYPHNLVVSCSACNDRIKKDNLYLPNLHPYFDDADKYFKFNVNDHEISIEINKNFEINEQLKAENYIKLFNLEERYKLYGTDAIEEVIDNIHNNLKRDFKNRVSLTRAVISESLKNELTDQLLILKERRKAKTFVKLQMDFLKQLSGDKYYQNYVTNFFESEYILGEVQ